MFWPIIAAIVGLLMIGTGVWLNATTDSEFWDQMLIGVGLYSVAAPWLERLRRKAGLPLKLPERDNPTIALKNWRVWFRPVGFLGAFIVAALIFLWVQVL